MLREEAWHCALTIIFLIFGGFLLFLGFGFSGCCVVPEEDVMKVGVDNAGRLREYPYPNPGSTGGLKLL